MIVGIIGLGFVGNAIYQSLLKKNIEITVYDKYKNIGSLHPCLNSSILFLALPTVYDSSLGSYNKQPIYETCVYLSEYKYNGVIIIKSTVEPNSTEELALKFPELNIIHNPEFLKAKTAEDDFHNQTHIVLGKSSTCKNEQFKNIINFYKTQISYGGLCFPKDTNALNQYMLRNNIPNGLLEACIKERNQMRNDHDNCNLY